MEERLIRFLKDNKAWSEFILELRKATKGATVESVMHGLKVSNSFDVALYDGVVLDYDSDLTEIDWRELSYKWVDLLKNEEVS